MHGENTLSTNDYSNINGSKTMYIADHANYSECTTTRLLPMENKHNQLNQSATLTYIICKAGHQQAAALSLEPHRVMLCCTQQLNLDSRPSRCILPNPIMAGTAVATHLTMHCNKKITPQCCYRAYEIALSDGKFLRRCD